MTVFVLAVVALLVVRAWLARSSLIAVAAYWALIFAVFYAASSHHVPGL